jgi:type IV pilus assembly protein PilY1
MSPVFTAHRSGGKAEGGDIVTVTFISGNKSSPLRAILRVDGQENSNNLEYDAVYAIYDYDIYPNGYYYPDHTKSLGARTLSSQASDTMSITKLKLIENTAKVMQRLRGLKLVNLPKKKAQIIS